MGADRILNSSLEINSLSDESGRRYFKLMISFSKEDVMTIYRNTIEELLEDLPQIYVSAARARIIQEKVN